VALLGLSEAARAALGAAITQAGGQVAVDAPARTDSLALMESTAPDVLILQPPPASGPHPDLLPFTSAGRPVVLYTHDTSRAMVKRAARSGVSAFLVEPLQAAQLAPTLELAIARFGDSETLRRKLADRKVIERAKGRLMTAMGISEDEAFRWLRTRAMDTRASLADVARAVVDTAVQTPRSPTPADLPERPAVRFGVPVRAAVAASQSSRHELAILRG